MKCRVCLRTLVPAEEAAPAWAYVLAHERCAKLERGLSVTEAGRAIRTWPMVESVEVP